MFLLSSLFLCSPSSPCTREEVPCLSSPGFKRDWEGGTLALCSHRGPQVCSCPWTCFSDLRGLSSTFPLTAYLRSLGPSFLQASSAVCPGLPPCFPSLPLPAQGPLAEILTYRPQLILPSLPHRRFVSPGSWLCEEGPRFSGRGLFGGPLQEADDLEQLCLDETGGSFSMQTE